MIAYLFTLVPRPIFIISDLARSISILVILWVSFEIMKWRFESVYLKVLFTLLLTWSLFIVGRGLPTNYQDIKEALFQPGGVFLYAVPLVLLLIKGPFFYRKMFQVIHWGGAVFLVYILLNLNILLNNDLVEGRDMLEVASKLLAWPACFILMTYKYHSKNRKLMAFLVMFIAILLAIYRARRGLFFIGCSGLVFAGYLFLVQNKSKIIIFGLAGIFTVLLALQFYSVFFKQESAFFGKAKERLYEDTRSGVEAYFYEDMDTRSWLVGRGMNGLIAAPESIDSLSSSIGYRDGIETEYLNIILKGGIIQLGLLLLIAIPGMILGLFFSRNLLAKASALWILLWLLCLYPTPITNFNLFYVLVWIAIGVCFSKSLRNIKDRELMRLLKVD